jgi:hypothetical protein
MFKFDIPADDSANNAVRELTSRISTTINRRTDQILQEVGITRDNAASYYGRVEIVDHSPTLDTRMLHREIFIDGNKVGEILLDLFNGQLQ